MFSSSFLSMYISSSWQDDTGRTSSPRDVFRTLWRFQKLAYLPVAHCQFLQEVAENQGRIFDQAVPEDLLGDGAHWGDVGGIVSATNAKVYSCGK